ncbi:MAG TPA: DUF2203 domain-containing protein [Planctomycetota bacterium]|nr:DUF2203 domain-containing protein [Planctomycetota bacterium]
MVRRRFTPKQANQTLPLVRRIVQDLITYGRERQKLSKRPNQAGSRERCAEIDARMRDLQDELARIGCAYKDWGFEMGLVDFPGEIGGLDVLLCWRSDEPAVVWYHTSDGGFAGRKPIPEELLE